MAKELQTELNALAGQYAKAVLDLAFPLGQAEQVGSELAEMESLLAQVSGLGEFLASPLVPTASKQAVVEKAFTGRASQLTQNLLGVMIHNGRGNLLGLLSAAYARPYNRRMGRVEVLVTTAVPLDEDLKAHVQQSLRQALSAEPLPQYRLDELLLGGVRVQVGDEIIDASLAAELKRLRQRLMDPRWAREA